MLHARPRTATERTGPLEQDRAFFAECDCTLRAGLLPKVGNEARVAYGQPNYWIWISTAADCSRRQRGRQPRSHSRISRSNSADALGFAHEQQRHDYTRRCRVDLMLAQ